jgi:hypothetical protein
MIGDNSLEALAEEKSITYLNKKCMINISDKGYVGPGEPVNKYNARYTDFRWLVKYKPYTANNHKYYLATGKEKSKVKKDEPFILICDLMPFSKLRFESWDTLQQLADNADHVDEKVPFSSFGPAIKWLMKYTNLSPEIIELAKAHLNCAIPLAFDAIKYNKEMAKKAKEAEKELGTKQLLKLPFASVPSALCDPVIMESNNNAFDFWLTYMKPSKIAARTRCEAHEFTKDIEEYKEDLKK